MKLIVCLDNKNGMAFYGCRQSRDAVVCEQILAQTGDSHLWMNEYSAKLFQQWKDRIRITEDVLTDVPRDSYCFLENVDPAPYLGAVEELWVFRWNRDYPSDLRFPMEIISSRLHRTATEEFSGRSHPCVTLEVYKL